MSAPTPAPGDDRPRDGYYPDPSIPGYVRYWNGAAWVPGTSRPAPTDGERLAPPPGAGPAQPSAAAPLEETGPHFFDEDPVDAPGASGTPSAADAQHGSRPEPASAWGADRSRQSGFGGDQDRRVSWGSPPGAPQGAQQGAPQGAQHGTPQSADPRVPRAAEPGDDPSQPAGRSARADGTATIPPAERDSGDVASGNTFVFRRPAAGPGGAVGGRGAADGSGPGAAGHAGTGPGGVAGGSGAADGSRPGTGPGGAAGGSGAADRSGPRSGPGAAGRAGTGTPGVPRPGGPPADEGTMTFRALSPRTAQQNRAGAPPGSTGTPGTAGPFGAQSAPTGGPTSPAAPGRAPFGPAAGPGDGSGMPGAGARPGAPGTPAFGAQPATGPGDGSGTPGAGAQPGTPGFGAGKAAADRAAAAQAGAPAPAQAPAPNVPQQAAASASAPMATGVGGGQPSWAQQVHRLAGASDEDQPVAPWKPPVDDIFQAAARRQSSARPAGLGKRLAARLVDTVVLGGVTAVVAVPLGIKALDHVNEKIDAAKLSGETVTIWLLDGTTTTYLGIVLAVLLLFGVLYEALPTAKWGRTLGKKLLGLDVRDIEGHEPPSFGAALRRWLVYSVPGLLAIGVVGVAWCLFDRPWHQCWHDKVAHTFVAG